MKELPNGIVIFNATPHVIRFWREDWEGPVEVGPDEVINASIQEEVVKKMPCPVCGQVGSHEYDCYNRMASDGDIRLVKTVFEPTDEGKAIVERAYKDGADVVVGSIIAAQAYSGWVVAMTPAPGYERVPPAEKRMNPDKFTVFSG